MTTIEQEADKLIANLFAQENARINAIKEANEKAQRKIQIETMAFEKLRIQHLEHYFKEKNKHIIFYLIFKPSEYYKQNEDNIVYKSLYNFYICKEAMNYSYHSYLLRDVENSEWYKLDCQWKELERLCPENYKPYLERLRKMIQETFRG